MDVSPDSVWRLGYQVKPLFPGLIFHMADIVDSKTRSRMMSGIKGKNTRPEALIRKRLHALGYRFRVHRRDLPGSPDIVLPKYKVAILVNGCFWHGHDCHLFKWPRTRPEFWSQKLLGNIRRDERNLNQLRELGWRVCVLWECEVKGAGEERLSATIANLAEWIEGESPLMHIPHAGTQKVNAGSESEARDNGMGQ